MKRTFTTAGLLVAIGIAAASVSRLSVTDGLVLGVALPAAVASASAHASVEELSSLDEVAGVTGLAVLKEDESAVAFALPAPGIRFVDAPSNQTVDSAGRVSAPDVALGLAASASSTRMAVPFHTQKDGDRFQGSNCGPAVLAMVLDAFGMQRGNSELRLLTHTYQGTVGARTGTALQHVAHVAADFGLEPTGLYQQPNGAYPNDGFARWTVEDIRAEVLAGRPVVPLVKFRLLPGHEDSLFRADHYVVIHGVDGDSFLYHDPIYDSPWEGAGRWMTADQLAAAMRPTLVPQQAVAFAPGSHAALATFRR